MRTSVSGFSISPSTPFEGINWNNFENRPPVSQGMPICGEKDWYTDTQCCMDYYSVEHVRDVANEYGLSDTPEVRFLDEHPCLNGLELDYFADRIEAMPSKVPEGNPTPQFPSFECLSQAVFDGLKKVLPQPLLDSIKPYLCRQ